MSDPWIVCRSLAKTYRTATGGIEALRSIDATFSTGQVTAIVGVSGSGKSTFLRLLAGLDRPTSGQLLFAGADLVGAPPTELRLHRRQQVTFVNQKPADNLIPHLTLAQHAHDAGEAALPLLVEVGLTHRLAAKPVELSGGEQARAAFALAVARGTPLIVIDEPTAELDSESARPLLQAIRQRSETGTTCVIATHDPDVSALADQILHLERGHLVTEAQARTLLQAGNDQQAGGDEVIRARSLTKTFRRGKETIRAVNHSTLAIKENELGVLLGRSGSGKSTLLSLLAGWQPPDSGEISWHGQPINPRTLRWDQLSYVPQRFGLIPELTVRENIELPAQLAGTPNPARADELLQALGLTELANRVPTETSIGQQQRTAIARALALRPNLLLADEPTSHQDAGWHDAVWQQLLNSTHNGTACLAATHEEGAANLTPLTWQIETGAVTPKHD